MKTRLIAGIVAVVLAAVGSVVLVSYVRGADARAMAGLETVDVLVAADAIPQGRSASDLDKLVETKQLPANVALPNRVTNLDQLAGEVALVGVDPGEQLLESKFGAPPNTDPNARRHPAGDATDHRAARAAAGDGRVHQSRRHRRPVHLRQGFASRHT